ncbi:MAG: DUF4198 domain-containing protein [Betaproteobacteria bacterium]|nr:DUF4198 domain-containing protein [Betaproteobacteria bacterium]NBU48819.1 DUF4198 domain-containing protein [Betaproteobacteria bacterium]
MRSFMGMSPCAVVALRGLVLAGGLAAALVARAHDTWFERHPSSTPQRPVMVLGTGNQFPVVDSRNDIHSLVRSGCQSGAVVQGPLEEAEPRAEALVLSPPRELPRSPRVTCWAQLQPFEVDLVDGLVEVYFKEAMPPASVRQAWAAQRARGQPWRERYVKHARIEWFTEAPAAPAAPPAPPAPSGMGLDALMLQPLKPPRVGDDLEFLVLKDGQPMAQFSVEFRLQTSRLGLWRRTDDHGRVRLRAPSAGSWLLRGIELTPPEPGSREPLWQGLFITLAFEVRPLLRP